MRCNLCPRTTKYQDAYVSDDYLGVANAGDIRVGNIKLLTGNVSPSGAMQAKGDGIAHPEAIGLEGVTIFY